jgi:hypothetical protein
VNFRVFFALASPFFRQLAVATVAGLGALLDTASVLASMRKTGFCPD